MNWTWKCDDCAFTTMTNSDKAPTWYFDQPHAKDGQTMAHADDWLDVTRVCRGQTFRLVEESHALG